MRKNSVSTVFCLLGLPFIAGLSGCAHSTQKKITDPKELLARACEPGRDIKTAKGIAWLKAQSKEASGQFPASVLAHASGPLKIEITNPLGGREALIEVSDSKFKIHGTGSKVRTQEGYGTWGGIPLNWASDLFIGRIPCPHLSSNQGQGVSTSVDSAGDLVVETRQDGAGATEKFIYHFRDLDGVPWPEALHWERSGPLAVSVDFKFDDPEDQTRSPRKWEAKSVRGEVRARWRDRNVVR